MTDGMNSEVFAGATAYEELHVPALFRQWVDPVLDAAGVGPGQRVVDVACGTGVLARGASARVGASGSVVGVDADPGMLAVAARVGPAIDFRQAFAESLPLPDRSVDAVVSQFGMMFFTDRVGAAREMRRVLRDGGRLAVAVWDAIERQPAFAIEVDILDELVGKDAADVLRYPFALGDPEEVREIFGRAGLKDVRVETRSGTARYPSVRSLVDADLRGWLPLVGQHLTEETIERVLEAADREMSRFVTNDGVVFDAPAHIISGTKL
jgi:ubiquinone/menaquinone biosynthesis C-methylase UbiE